MAAIVIWFGVALNMLQTCSISLALASPVPIQTEDDSLLGLLMQYSQVVVELGEEHPTRVSLRSRIDEKLNAGERLDQEKMVATLNELRTQYRTARAELVESHPSLVKLTANIATLAELSAHEPEDLVSDLDAVMRAKDDWGSGILYVHGGGLTGYVHRIKPDATEITILKGADNGLKVGMHLHLYVRQGALERWRPDGKNYIMGRVESVEPNQAQVKLLAGIPNTELPTSIFYMQPGFNVGSLILTIRFDEAAWKNRPLMNAFLGELRIACSEGDLVKPKILVIDTPRTDCVIDVLPIGPSGHSEDQLRTLNELAKFVAEQPYFLKVKLNSVTTSPKTSSPAEEKPKPPKSDRNGLKTLNDADKWEVIRMANLKQALEEWQNNKLHGRQADAMPDLLSHLRTKSEEAEKASIAKASEVRSALAAKPAKPSEEIEKLKAELRDAVDGAFDARQRLHLMEVTSLTIKVQTMLSNLSDRLESRTEIVDRRIDDLLNPNYLWEASLTQESSVAKPSRKTESLRSQPGSTTQNSEDPEGTARRIGWNTVDGVLELIVQITPDRANTLENEKELANVVNESTTLIPDGLKGRCGRIVVRIGTEVLPREPTIEKSRLLPLQPNLPMGSPLDEDFFGWEMADDGQLQIIVTISPEKKKAMKQRSVQFPNGQETVANLPSPVMLRASKVIVRVADRDATKIPRSPSVEEIANWPIPSDVYVGVTTLGSVEGLVTFRGKPITGTVWFNSPGSLPTPAGIKEDGKFKLDSLKPGKYKLTIDAESRDAAKEVPAKYKSSETTPIEFEVLEGKNVFDVELKNPFTTTTNR